jgi:acid phosphatase family membrane protein YuiD
MEYIYLICPFSTLLIGQLIKLLSEIIKNKKLDIKRLTNGDGGMPSSHTAFISSITMLIGFKQGFNTPLFAFAFIVSCIISYDSMGVRLETEKQGKAIKELGKKHNLEFKLKEHLGHKMSEVIVGYIFGTIMAFLYSLI